jgi:hypothetical protein
MGEVYVEIVAKQKWASFAILSFRYAVKQPMDR